MSTSQRAALCLARLVLQQLDAAGLAVIGGGIRCFVPREASHAISSVDREPATGFTIRIHFNPRRPG